MTRRNPNASLWRAVRSTVAAMPVPTFASQAQLSRKVREVLGGKAPATAVMYYSPSRPVSEVRHASLIPVAERWAVSLKPFDLDTVIELELVPYGLGMARFLLDASSRFKLPIELTRVAQPDLETGFTAQALFRNPRGRWQLSHFDAHGPSGHEESTDPIEDLYRALAGGYRYWNPGAVDALVSNIRGNPGMKYVPDASSPPRGEWDRSGSEPRWRQAHDVLVRDALTAWKGDPITLRLHMGDAESGAPYPPSGSGKIMRTQAVALLWELEHRPRTSSKPLYRGDHEKPSGVQAWSERKSVAERWAAKNHGRVWMTPKGAPGLRVADYIDSTMNEAEREWLVWS